MSLHSMMPRASKNAMMSVFMGYSFVGAKSQIRWIQSSAPEYHDLNSPISATVSVKPQFSFVGSLTVSGQLYQHAGIVDQNKVSNGTGAAHGKEFDNVSIFQTINIQASKASNTFELFEDLLSLKNQAQDLTHRVGTAKSVSSRREPEKLVMASKAAGKQTALVACKEELSVLDRNVKSAAQQLRLAASYKNALEMKKAGAAVLHSARVEETDLYSRALLCKALLLTGQISLNKLATPKDLTSSTHSFFEDVNEGSLVYTDGSFTISRNKPAGTGGYGVYWAPNDPRNQFGCVPNPTSNLESELFGISAALEQIRLLDPGAFTIMTDSMSSLQMISKCASHKNTVAPDLAAKASALYVELIGRGYNLKIRWVRGHSGDHGNCAAHSLADKGLKMNFPGEKLPLVVLKEKSTGDVSAVDGSSGNKAKKAKLENKPDITPQDLYLPPMLKVTDAPPKKGRVIYTDGSSRGNGNDNAAAGQGVYWGENDYRNFSGPVPGRQTSNRAELSAVISAFHQISFHPVGRYIVRVDSVYVKTVVENAPKWAQKNWRNSSGAVSNLDLVKMLFEKHKSLIKLGYRVDIEKVLGHSGDIGNDRADKLATSHSDKILAQ